jgi:hypothetical protein
VRRCLFGMRDRGETLLDYHPCGGNH